MTADRWYYVMSKEAKQQVKDRILPKFTKEQQKIIEEMAKRLDELLREEAG